MHRQVDIELGATEADLICRMLAPPGNVGLDLGLQHVQRQTAADKYSLVKIPDVELRAEDGLRLAPKCRDLELPDLIGAGLARLSEIAVDFGLSVTVRV